MEWIPTVKPTRINRNLQMPLVYNAEDKRIRPLIRVQSADAGLRGPPKSQATNLLLIWQDSHAWRSAASGTEYCTSYMYGTRQTKDDYERSKRSIAMPHTGNHQVFPATTQIAPDAFACSMKISFTLCWHRVGSLAAAAFPFRSFSHSLIPPASCTSHSIWSTVTARKPFDNQLHH
jgi:hypothetical protein